MAKSRKDDQIFVRVTSEQKEEIRDAADREHLDMATFVRSTVLKEVERQKRERTPDASQAAA